MNCQRTLPWVRGVLEHYGREGLTVVGVHTPEFAYERQRKRVEEALRREKIEYPQYLDNDHSYWRALGTEAWPTLYLVDRCGFIRRETIGEVHAHELSGKRLESAIETLLAENSGC